MVLQFAAYFTLPASHPSAASGGFVTLPRQYTGKSFNLAEGLLLILLLQKHDDEWTDASCREAMNGVCDITESNFCLVQLAAGVRQTNSQ